MRLLKAVALLRNPDTKVINVAEDCGFNHLGLFNTCFKRRFGTSPGQWRKQAVLSGDHSAEVGGAAAGCPLRVNGLCPLTDQPKNQGAVPQQPAQTKKADSARASLDAQAPHDAGVILVVGEQKLGKITPTRAFVPNR